MLLPQTCCGAASAPALASRRGGVRERLLSLSPLLLLLLLLPVLLLPPLLAGAAATARPPRWGQPAPRTRRLACGVGRRRTCPPLAACGAGGLRRPDCAPDRRRSQATPRLWQLIQKQLRRPSGIALVAAKSYYFGVGGSVAAFCALVQADPRFVCQTVRTFEDGASNRREVLQVRWRDASEAPGPAAAGTKRSRSPSEA